MMVLRVALLLLISHLCSLSLAQDAECKDEYPWYCNTWNKYCNKFKVLREEWCRMTCKTCEPQEIEPDVPTHSCQSGSLSNTDLTNFQKNSNEFALKLYTLAREEAGKGNVFFSPASISLALGMVLAGAEGSTKNEIKAHLARDLNDNEITKAFAWLMKELNGQPTNYTLYTANAMYVQQDMTLEQEFSQIVAQCFKSTAELRDFRTQSEAVRQEVNKWVEDKTNDRIKDLIPQGVVNAMTRMILVNAIYFKAEWLTPFTEGSQTYKRNFYPLSDPQNGKQIDFMNMKANFPYFENDDLQILELPYRRQELSMYILLPRERTGLTNLESTLTEQRLSELIAGVQPRQVQVSIPKWKLTQKLPLKKVLKKMGMTKMFSDSADLSGITGGRDLFVSDALHKAFIEVNEKGTEAAAATAFIGVGRAFNPNPPPRFEADRPFLFFIRHTSTNNPLFLGSLTSI